MFGRNTIRIPRMRQLESEAYKKLMGEKRILETFPDRDIPHRLELSPEQVAEQISLDINQTTYPGLRPNAYVITNRYTDKATLGRIGVVAYTPVLVTE